MEINLYAVLLLLSIITLFLLLRIGRTQSISTYLIIFVTVIISNIGYFTISTTDNIEVALVGFRMTYLTGVFAPLLILLAVNKLCHLNISRVITGGLFAVGLIIFSFSFTVGHSDIYYKSLSLGQENGMTYMIKEYGPVHSLYTAFLLVTVAITFIAIGYSFFKKLEVPKSVTFWLFAAELATLICYFGKRITGYEMEIITIAYLLDEIVILFLIKKIGKYAVSESVATALEEHNTYGYVIFDENGRYTGSNDLAKEYFPGLRKMRLDEYLSEEITPVLCEKIGDKFEAEERTFDFFVERDEKVIKCIFRHIYDHKPDCKKEKKKGYLLELEDNTKERKYLELLNNYNADLEEEVQEKTEYINALQEKLVLGMADMIENRDSNTGGHIKRTSEVIKIFTGELKKVKKEYGITGTFLSYVVKAAPMHDLGKIAVDDQILRKPGKYTPEEFEEMKKHSEKGAEIVANILEGVEDEQFSLIAKNVAHYHHEKWNGKGYPSGLSGTAIPIEARIMALADVFDALVSKRCYKEKMDYDSAFKIIEESLGEHFDPELGRMFIKCRPRLETFYDMQME